MPAVLEIVAKKVSDGELSPEESKFLSKESEKIREDEALKEKINNSALPVSKPQYTAGNFFDEPLPIGNEVLLPPGYVMTSAGVFAQVQGEDTEEYIRLTRTPFFVASRTRTHILLTHLSKEEWLREWLRPSEVKPSTLSNLFIFPEQNIKIKSLVEYTLASAAASPLVRGDDYMESVVQEFYRLYVSPIAEYPFLARTNDLVKLCGEMEAKYEEVRKWMERHGFLEHGPGKVVRAPDPAFPGKTKAQRFLILLKPFPVKLDS